MSVLEVTAVAQSSGDEVTVFAVNRGAEALDLELVLRDLEGVAVREHIVLTDDDLTAANTAERPDRVTPSTISVSSPARVSLAPRSWNVVRLAGS